MSYISIPKKEYQQLKKQARTLRQFYVRFFRAALTDPVDDVVEDFRNTKLYSKGFLRDLEAGLRKSSYGKRV